MCAGVPVDGVALGVLHVSPHPGSAHLMELLADLLRTCQSRPGECHRAVVCQIFFHWKISEVFVFSSGQRPFFFFFFVKMLNCRVVCIRSSGQASVVFLKKVFD